MTRAFLGLSTRLDGDISGLLWAVGRIAAFYLAPRRRSGKAGGGQAPFVGVRACRGEGERDAARADAHEAGKLEEIERCLDETGFRVAGKTQWRHTVATDTLTLYRVAAKRGDIPKDLVGGVVVHGGFKPYRGPDGVAHALCNAHHLRELKAVIEFDKEPWAEPMRDLLIEANRTVDEAGQRGQTRLDPAVAEAFDARYWELLKLGFSYHRKRPRLPRRASNKGRDKRRPEHNLLMRLHKFKDDVLRFLADFDVPFTNNLAEQALRMMKVKMKISDAFRTLAAADTCFAALRSLVATARTRRWNILQTITANPKQIEQAPRSPTPSLGVTQLEETAKGQLNVMVILFKLTVLYSTTNV